MPGKTEIQARQEKTPGALLRRALQTGAESA
jgi:hypothetical protein